MLKNLFLTAVMTVFDFLFILSLLTIVSILGQRELNMDSMMFVFVLYSMAKVNYRDIK